MVRHCVVSITGKDSQRYSVKVDAISLFDAAYKARQQWAVLWWFLPDALIEVRSDDGSWNVRQDRLRVWATGSTRRRRREF